ncbi:hypothetical protein Q1695_001570 [Nippostrongylus brasiliensis]|nr:hypothetical protein Q1695_001570 [Nippostrongylus brasiliensis]
MIRMPLIMTLVACLFTLPCSFEYYLEPCLDKGRELLQRQETTMMRNAVYHVLYRTIVLSVMKTFGPFVIITLLTVSTVKSLRHSMDNRGTILMQQGKDHLFAADKDKTKSLQTISMLLLGKFLLLRCWPTSLEMLRVFFGENVLSHAPVLSFDGSEFCLLLNSATNAFVFVVLKSAFETRRLKRIRMRQREMVARHVEQVLCIGKALAADRTFLIDEEVEQCESSVDGAELGLDAVRLGLLHQRK